jgi:hypothetical protein
MDTNVSIQKQNNDEFIGKKEGEEGDEERDEIEVV